MTRLSQLLVVLMMTLSTLCALEPDFGAPGSPGARSSLIASSDHTDPLSDKKLPPCHVCCGSNLPAPAPSGAGVAMRVAVRSVEAVDPAPRLAGLSVSPRSPPPRA